MTDEVFAAIHRYISAIHPGNRPERIKITLADGSKIDLRFPAMFDKKSDIEFESKTIRHSPDYRSVTLGKSIYSFTPGQAAIVAYLHEAQIEGIKEVSAERILEDVASTNKRMADIFKRHPAWGTFIVPGSTRGTYRLDIPE